MMELVRQIATRPFETISPRPSKTYFYSKFLRDVRAHSNVERAADIASARFDNAEVFESDYYFGVDLDSERLRKGRSRYSDCPSRIAIKADITRPVFQQESLDLIACSHTLSHLEQSDHVPTVEQLISYLKPGGSLFIQFHEGAFTDDIEETLRESFEEVEVIHYNNSISKAFERRNIDEEGVIDADMDGWKWYLNGPIILLLAGLEHLPLPGRKYTYARCLRKRH